MDLQIVNAAAGDASITAEVNADYQLSCKGVGVSAIHEATLKGDAYAWNTVSADLIAGDTALIVCNESRTQLLVIHSCYIACDLATTIDFHLTHPGTWAGTAVTGVNLNRGSNNIAAATAYADETGSSQGDIILTGVSMVHTVGEESTCEPVTYNFEDAVILAEHDCFGVDVVGNTAARFETTIIAYYIDL